MSADRTSRPLGRLWRYGRAYRGRVAVAGLYSALDKLFDLAPPFLIGLAVDIVANESDSLLSGLGIETARGQLVALGVLTFIVWGLESTFEFLAEVAWRNLAQDVQHDLRVDTYQHLQTLEHGFFERRHTGDLQAVLNDDVNQLERFLDVGANELIQLVTTVVVIGATFFAIAPQVAWWSFLPVPIVLWGAFWFQRRLEPRYAAVRDRAGMLNASLGNRLLGMATIKSFGGEQRETELITEESDAYRMANHDAIRLSSAFIPLIRMAIVIGFIGTLVYGGFLALEGDVLTVGQYSVMVFLTQRLLWPLTRLGETFDLYQRAMASAARILDVIDTKPTIAEGPPPSSGPRDRARPPSSSCCCGSTSPTRVASRSTTCRSTACHWPICGPPSVSSARTRTSSTARSGRTSPTGGRTPTKPTSSPPPRSPKSTASWPTCPMATTP
jgi:ATP-binding cassette subfamily B protein